MKEEQDKELIPLALFLFRQVGTVKSYAQNSLQALAE